MDKKEGLTRTGPKSRRTVYRNLTWTLPKSPVDLKTPNNEMDSLGRTQLHLFCSTEDSSEFVSMLLRCGANPNTRDKKSWTPLHVACYFGNAEVVSLLLAAGAELDARIATTLDTPLHLACEGGFKEAVSQLLKFNPKTTAKNKDSLTPLDLAPSELRPEIKELFAIHDEVFARDKHGQTQLHKAAATGNLEKVEQFLKRGVDVNIRDHAGWSPLHEAALAGHVEILQLLIESGADVNAKGLNNDTALHDACENGHAKIVETLILNGADVDVVNDDGKTPLDVTDDEQLLQKIKDHIKQRKIIPVNRLAMPKPPLPAPVHTTEVPVSREEKKIAQLMATLTRTNGDEKKAKKKTSRADRSSEEPSDSSPEPQEKMKKQPVSGDSSNVDSKKKAPLHKAGSDNDLMKTKEKEKAKEKEKEKDREKEKTPKEKEKEREREKEKDKERPKEKDHSKESSRDNPKADQKQGALKGGSDKPYSDKDKKPSSKETPKDAKDSSKEVKKESPAPKREAPRDSGKAAAEESEQEPARKKAKVEEPVELPLDEKDKHGRTIAHKAALAGDVEILIKYVNAGLDLNAGDNGGWTPLHKAALNGKVEACKFLLSRGANVNCQAANKDTPLHDAVENQHIEIVRLLLQNGASVTTKNEQGSTPFDVCDDDDIRQLLKSSQDSNKHDKTGRTLLHRSCASADIPTIKRLLSEGANIAMKDFGGWTPLHEASLKGHTEVVKLLVSQGINVNPQANNLDTPLHDAAENGHLEVVRILVKAGADVTLKNQLGQTSIEVTDDEEILTILKNANSKLLRKKKMERVSSTEAADSKKRPLEDRSDFDAVDDSSSKGKSKEAKKPKAEASSTKEDKGPKAKSSSSSSHHDDSLLPFSTEEEPRESGASTQKDKKTPKPKKRIEFAGYQKFDLSLAPNAASMEVEPQPQPQPQQQQPQQQQEQQGLQPQKPRLDSEKTEQVSPQPPQAKEAPLHDEADTELPSPQVPLPDSPISSAPSSPPAPAAKPSLEAPTFSPISSPSGSPPKEEEEQEPEPPTKSPFSAIAVTHHSPSSSSSSDSESSSSPLIPEPTLLKRLEGIPRELAEREDPLNPLFSISLLADSASRQEDPAAKFVLDIQASLLLQTSTKDRFDSEALFDKYPALLVKRRLLNQDERAMFIAHQPPLFSSGVLEVMKKVEWVNLIPIGDIVAIIRKDFRQSQNLVQNAAPVALDLSVAYVKTFLEEERRKLLSMNGAQQPGGKTIPPKMALKMKHKVYS